MPHRVLVVDDEEAIRTLVQDYLEGQGYSVTCASDGEEGIKAFQGQAPHLVLIDFLLPRKNGFAVAEAIRRHETRATTPIIMMSGVFKNPKTAVEAREKYRVVDFLSKPLDMARLSSLIGRTLERVPSEDPTDLEPRVAVVAEPALERGGSIATMLADTEEAPPARGLSYYGRGSFAGSMSRSRGMTGVSGIAGSPAPSGESGPLSPSSLSGFGNTVEDDPPPSSSVATSSPSRGRSPQVRVESHAVEGGVFRGRPFPPVQEEGELEQLPVAMVLSIIRYDVLTGMLDLTDGGTHRRIYIVRGLPTFMQSNAEGENVGALLLRRGRITEPDFQRCLTYMKAKGRTLQQALLELRLANEHDLSTAYKLLAGQLLPLALGMASGKFRWRETDAFIGRVPEGNFEPVQVLFEGIKRHVHPPQILRFFKGREDVPLIKTTEFEKLMPFFRRAFSANNIASEIGGKNTYREITRKHSSQAASAVPQLFALVTSGMAVVPEVTEDNAMEIAVNMAAAEIIAYTESESLAEASPGEAPLEFADEDEDAGFSAEEKRARAAILRYHEDVFAKNFFEIFGANQGTEVERIKSVYFELAKKWHADTYADMNLGSARQKLDAIFQHITEAYETITDKAKREEYIVFLDRQRRGLPTDVNQILRGEQLFDQAQAMIRRRDWAGAKPVLDEAIRLNPGDALYYANLGWVTFNANQQSQNNVNDAIQYLRRAIQEQSNCPLAYQYLGQIAFSRGQGPEARKWWTKCLEWEPNNIEASRGIRMLNTREEKERNAKSGILSKFLNKK